MYFVFFLQASFGNQRCDDRQNDLEQSKTDEFCSPFVIFSHENSDDNAKYEAAKVYLLSIEYEKEFDEMVVNQFIRSITAICDNDNGDVVFQSNVCLILSKLHGKMADKLRMNGLQNAKNMFRYVKKAMELDPNNVMAVNQHAKAILGVYNEGPIGRKVAAKLLTIDLRRELQDAKDNLERLKLTISSIYKKIVDALS